MVAGFYVSFGPPGSMAVGLYLAHAILPKETWLARHDIATSSPVWGVMKVVLWRSLEASQPLRLGVQYECPGRYICTAYRLTSGLLPDTRIPLW
jgi:hypothetical protein